MDAATRAEHLFTSGHYCAEAVLTALAEMLGAPMDLIPQIASGFCSGISRNNGPCGACTGAVMGLGLAFGRTEPRQSTTSRAEMDICYAHVQEFWERFEQECGSTQCRDLTGCDFSTPEGLLRFREENGIEKCTEFVRRAAAIAENIIDEETGDAPGTES